MRRRISLVFKNELSLGLYADLMAISIETSSFRASAAERHGGQLWMPSWDSWRRKLVANGFGRLFRRVGSGLCEPGGLPAYGIHRVLVCRPNHRLGNNVLLGPLIEEIERLYPGAEIDIVGGAAAVVLYASRFRVHKVFALPRRVARHLFFTLRLLRDIRSARYDLAIDASIGSQSGRLLLALAHARFKLGFPDAAVSPASAWHVLAWPDHLAQRGVFLLRSAYAGDTDSAYPPLDVGLSLREKEEAAEILALLCRRSPSASRPVVGIFTNATGAKRYAEAWWIQFLQTFQSRCPDVEVVDLVAAHGSSQLGERFVPFYTQNLRHLAAMIASMDAFISADCGVMHLAAASGAPTLGLFSTTDPAKYAPYGGANAALSTQTMDATAVATAAARWFNNLPHTAKRYSTAADGVGDPRDMRADRPCAAAAKA